MLCLNTLTRGQHPFGPRSSWRVQKVPSEMLSFVEYKTDVLTSASYFCLTLKVSRLNLSIRWLNSCRYLGPMNFLQACIYKLVSRSKDWCQIVHVCADVGRGRKTRVRRSADGPQGVPRRDEVRRRADAGPHRRQQVQVRFFSLFKF